MMNAGAYGGEMKQVLVSARILTRDGSICEMPVEEMELGYRTSIFAKNGDIVLSAVLKPALMEDLPRLVHILRQEMVSGL